MIAGRFVMPQVRQCNGFGCYQTVRWVSLACCPGDLPSCNAKKKESQKQMAAFLCNSIWMLSSVPSAITLNTFGLLTVYRGSEIWLCFCLWLCISDHLCTQDIKPADGCKPRTVATVSQYACQRRTTTQNHNTIFTVRSRFLNLTVDKTALLCPAVVPAA